MGEVGAAGGIGPQAEGPGIPEGTASTVNMEKQVPFTWRESSGVPV